MNIFFNLTGLLVWSTAKVLTLTNSVLFYKGGLLIKIALAGSFAGFVGSLDLFNGQGVSFLENQDLITGGVGNQTAEVTLALCNHFSDILGVEYTDVLTGVFSGVAHSCALDVLIRTPYDFFSCPNPSMYRGMGQLFLSHGNMGNSSLNVSLGLFSELALQKTGIMVTPIFSNQTDILQLMGGAFIEKFGFDVNQVIFVTRGESDLFGQEFLQKACLTNPGQKGPYCYMLKDYYVTDFYNKITLMGSPHDKIIVRAMR